MNHHAEDFDLRAYLLAGASTPSTWAVQRNLLDRTAGINGTFTGVVRFLPTHDGGLELREEGTVRWPTFSGPASRAYLLRRTQRSDALAVFFADGRPFHQMSFSADAAADQHWCDPDTYRVAYTYGDTFSFGYTWDVQGPQKDYLLSSRLQLQDSPVRPLMPGALKAPESPTTTAGLA